jgi:hypothetical protein
MLAVGLSEISFMWAPRAAETNLTAGYHSKHIRLGLGLEEGRRGVGGRLGEETDFFFISIKLVNPGMRGFLRTSLLLDFYCRYLTPSPLGRGVIVVKTKQLHGPKVIPAR